MQNYLSQKKTFKLWSMPAPGEDNSLSVKKKQEKFMMWSFTISFLLVLEMHA